MDSKQTAFNFGWVPSVFVFILGLKIAYFLPCRAMIKAWINRDDFFVLNSSQTTDYGIMNTDCL